MRSRCYLGLFVLTAHHVCTVPSESSTEGWSVVDCVFCRESHDLESPWAVVGYRSRESTDIGDEGECEKAPQLPVLSEVASVPEVPVSDLGVE